jgi:hypothetical protein
MKADLREIYGAPTRKSDRPHLTKSLSAIAPRNIFGLETLAAPSFEDEAND